ncbi:MAG: polysaccharide biosynthesis protein [Clostridia bacterium]|nr:polysaccharide biosynthesis protein [Clostridia bacterium]
METLRRFGRKLKTVTGSRRRWALVLYDTILLLIVELLILGVYPSSNEKFTVVDFVLHSVLCFLCVYICRCVCVVYRQVWRYGSASAYIRLILADTLAGILYFTFQSLLPIRTITFIRVFSIAALNLLMAMGIRLMYQFLYEKAKTRSDGLHGWDWKLFELLSGSSVTPLAEPVMDADQNVKIKIAIVGAGTTGTHLAEELLMNPRAAYMPCCFLDNDRDKIGRRIMGISVLNSTDFSDTMVHALGIQEIVFALPPMDAGKKKELYEFYRKTGCKIKTYDYPMLFAAGNSKRHMREFDIEELLFRQPIEFHDERTSAYYRNKVVLITGGGGSIGSELCRQIARMQPKQLIILDVYENGAYDVQQELRIAYGKKLNLQVEIVSVCDRRGLEVIFKRYQPDILIHAAAHKHVPLMEHNCCEAVKNNVFGTLNVVELCEQYNVGRFMMVSTDKAVNPTNVMGATKRMCEMIVQSHSKNSKTTVYSATRFGNVLGSAGSVIPLFKKQIMNGGPITVTDKRIIRYFMTIPEASQLVLQSGAMAKNGELFVLDMGKPVKILELAENMIRLSGFEPYRDIDIIETGLRPGEKLYEELLIRTEELDKTENSMIFIERDMPLERSEIQQKLALLRSAVETEDDDTVKDALKEAVPTFYKPEDVNRDAVKAREMRVVLENDRKLVEV